MFASICLVFLFQLIRRARRTYSFAVIANFMFLMTLLDRHARGTEAGGGRRPINKFVNFIHHAQPFGAIECNISSTNG